MQVIQVETTDIAQLDALEIIPDTLIRIEVGCIARQLFQVQALGGPSLEKVFDLVSPMDWRPIPDHDNLARELAQEDAQEARHVCRIIGSGTHLQKESSIEGNATDR